MIKPSLSVSHTVSDQKQKCENEAEQFVQLHLLHGSKCCWHDNVLLCQTGAFPTTTKISTF